MARSLAYALLLLFGAGLALDAEGADGSGLTPELHPWGRFRPGAWKQYRVVVESFDEQGKALSAGTTLTTITLRPSGDARSVVLEFEAVVEMSGKRLETPPSVVKQGFHGEPAGERSKVLPLGKAELTIGGQKIACQLERLETEGPGGKTVTTTWYSTTVAPHVLRRESKSTDPQGATSNETTLAVTALGVRCEGMPQTNDAAEMTVTTVHAHGKRVTKAVTSIDVPGGVVCHVAEEFDAKGRLVRRETLALVDYGLSPRKEGGLLNRLRTRPHRVHRGKS